MEAPIPIVLLGVDKAADDTTAENYIETLGMIRRLPLVFQARYFSRLAGTAGHCLATARGEG